MTIWREKGRDLTQSCDKNPYTHRTIQKATWQHKNATRNFDYTTIADRLRTVSWSNSSHPTGVVKPVYERSTFPLTAQKHKTHRLASCTCQTMKVTIYIILLTFFIWFCWYRHYKQTRGAYSSLAHSFAAECCYIYSGSSVHVSMINKTDTFVECALKWNCNSTCSIETKIRLAFPHWFKKRLLQRSVASTTKYGKNTAKTCITCIQIVNSTKQ